MYPTADPRTWEQRNYGYNERTRRVEDDTNQRQEFNTGGTHYLNLPPDPQLKYNPGRWDEDTDDPWVTEESYGRNRSRTSTAYRQTTLAEAYSHTQRSQHQGTETSNKDRFPSSQDYAWKTEPD